MPGSQCRTEVPHSSFSPKISLRRLERSMGGCTPAVEPPPCTPPLPFVQGTGSPGSRSIEQSQGRCGGNWRLSASKKAEVMILRRDVLTLSMGLCVLCPGESESGAGVVYLLTVPAAILPCSGQRSRNSSPLTPRKKHPNQPARASP